MKAESPEKPKTALIWKYGTCEHESIEMEIKRYTTWAGRIHFNPDISLIVSVLPFDGGENVMEREEKLLTEGLRGHS